MKLTDFITIGKPTGAGLWTWYTAKFGDVVSIQKSRDEAVKELMQCAKEALIGSYEPVLLFHGVHYACCFREWDGWRYAIRAIGTPLEKGGWTQGFSSKEECVEYARKHLEKYED